MKNKKGGIIVEAPDQFGKSTFCKKLQEELHMPIIHYKPPKEGTLQFEYYTHLLDNPTEGPYIFDRNYVSELVYGPLFRGGSAIDKSEQKRIENKFKEYNYFVVLLKRKNYKWEDREEMFTREQNEQIIKGYATIDLKLSLDVISVDGWDDDAVSRVVEFWKEKNEIE